MDRTRLAAFATCLATSLEPFFSRFSQRTPANVFADLTALLWEVFANSESQLKARTILESVSAMPLAGEDDSNNPDFEAMRALSTVAYAAQVWVHKEPVHPAIWAMYSVQSIAQDLGYVLRDGALFSDVLGLAHPEESEGSAR